MKNSIFITVFILCCCRIYSQTLNQNNYSSAFLIESNTSVYYNAIGNNPIFFINNTNDDFYHISLIKKRFKRYYVRIKNLSLNDSYAWYGWISRSATGITFASETIELFENPRNTSKNTIFTVPLGSIILQVLDYRKNGWMKVSFYLHNLHYIGWLPPKYQCSNYFTMCCGY